MTTKPTTTNTSTSTARPLPPAPPTGRYRILELLHAPNRLVHPGQLIEKRLEKRQAPTEKFNGATAGKVSHSIASISRMVTDPLPFVLFCPSLRNFRSTSIPPSYNQVRGARVKLCEVTLDDVIQGRYTPPLTLRDFEDYLAFKEKSAENLYFHLWVQEYAKLYNAHTQSDRPHDEVMLLGASFRTAVDTFFAAQSPLELNVPSDLRRQIDSQIKDASSATAATPNNEAFLPPAAFDKCHHEASESLAVSFKAFIKQVSRNADRNRGWFAIFLGGLTYLLGLIPTSELLLLHSKARCFIR